VEFLFLDLFGKKKLNNIQKEAETVQFFSLWSEPYIKFFAPPWGGLAF